MALKNEEIRKSVSEFYAALIQGQGSCCSAGCCSPEPGVGVAEALGYQPSELDSIPREAKGSSFGCGNPLAFAEVMPGETVLDLGSGGGMDCFLAAQRVGDSGKVIGLDMTQEMVEKARKTAAENGYRNVEFRLGKIEEMPVESGSVDWVISNCVINLSPEKEKVFAESYRVLKPGGKLLISDVVAEGLPEDMRQDISAWASCVAGAVTEDEYLAMIRDAGFEQVSIVDRVDYVTPSESQPYRLSSIRVRGVKTSGIGKQESHMGGTSTKIQAFADGLLGTHLEGRAEPGAGAGCCPASSETVGEDGSRQSPGSRARGASGCCSSGLKDGKER